MFLQRSRVKIDLEVAMTLAEAIKHILLNRSKNLLTDFLLEDFKTIFSDWGKEISSLLKTGAGLKFKGRRFTYSEIKEAFRNSYELVKILPERVKDGFQQFYRDFLTELEMITDPKEKSIFSIKVIGSLVSTVLGLLYSIKKGTATISLHGLKKQGVFTSLIATDLLIRIIYSLVQRFLTEIDLHVDDVDEKKHLRYFINLMSNQNLEVQVENHDMAIQIVQQLRTFIMTGHREN